MLTVVTIMTASFLVSVQGNAQEKKLPDGTIVYNDGTRRLPNGTIISKDGTTVKNSGRKVILRDGKKLYSDGSKRYHTTRRHRRHSQWMPPGQAKKIYGGSARDYSPGQQKKGKQELKEDDDDHNGKKNHDRKDNDDDNGNGGHGKHGNGRKD